MSTKNVRSYTISDRMQAIREEYGSCGIDRENIEELLAG